MLAASVFFSAPAEVVVASIFLCQVLGWSAFTGLLAILVAMPINNYLSKKGVSLTKQLALCRG